MTTILLFFSLFAFCRTIVVSAGQSITKVIEQAKNGDTIKVMPGVYREGSITITKSITLIGINFPVIDGQSQFENLVISGTNTKVSGFILKDSRHSSSNDYSAINIIDATGIIIDNNKVINAHSAFTSRIQHTVPFGAMISVGRPYLNKVPAMASISGNRVMY
ncbi:MAG: hypothetical protein HC867_08580 [Bacteroidia bacterium]|nr:hypothetical protein [Bacteroidia bacterium]